MEKDGRRTLWIPDDDIEIEQRLLISAHLNEAGHRGVEASFQPLLPFCLWRGMRGDVEEFIRQCLFCTDYKSDGLIPCTDADTVHGTKLNEVMHFDCLYVGPRKVKGGLDTLDGFWYLLVLLEDLLWVRLAAACKGT